MRSTTNRFGPTAALARAALALMAVLGGCGRSAAPPVPGPTFLGVNPAAGLAVGGTPITITGTNFLGAVSVKVGGMPATNVVVLSDVTVTCVTPPGPPGAQAAIQVIAGGGQVTQLGVFTYIPPPKLIQSNPNATSFFGGITHLLGGTGFIANGAGPNAVTIGGVPASNVNTISDVVVQFTAPALPAGLHDIVVTNNNGASNALVLRYFVPIMAAEGGFPSSIVGGLYAVDPQTGDAYFVGSTGVPIAGMDFHPVTGVLYGVTSTAFRFGGPLHELVTIDPTNGLTLPIGPLNDGGAVNQPVTDITFVGGVLYGMSGLFYSVFASALVQIDHLTGLVTPNPDPLNTVFAGGNAIAADAASTTVVYVPVMGFGFPVWFVTVGTNTFTPGPITSSPTVNVMNAATYYAGAPYLVTVPWFSAPEAHELWRLDPATGLLTLIGALPTGIHAIASPIR